MSLFSDLIHHLLYVFHFTINRIRRWFTPHLTIRIVSDLQERHLQHSIIVSLLLPVCRIQSQLEISAKLFLIGFDLLVEQALHLIEWQWRFNSIEFWSLREVIFSLKKAWFSEGIIHILTIWRGRIQCHLIWQLLGLRRVLREWVVVVKSYTLWVHVEPPSWLRL